MVPFESRAPSVVGDALRIRCERDERRAVMLAVRGGPGRIRTSVGVNRRVYSPFPLAARAPTQRRLRYRFGFDAPKTPVGLTSVGVLTCSVYFVSWVHSTLFLK